MTEHAEFYDSKSKGPTRIKGMPNRHLKNSLNILETREPHRLAEILAMRAEVERQDAEYAAQQEADAAKPDYAPGDEVEVIRGLEMTGPGEADLRHAIGANFPPEETPFEAHEVMDAVDAASGPDLPNVAGYWSSLEITMRNAAPLADLGKVKVSAAAITAVTDDTSAEAAGVVVKELRRVRQSGEDAFTAEKAPILAATKVCDEFGRPFKALTAEQTRIERLIGVHQAKVAEDRRKALAEAAEAERQKARDLEAAAAQQEDAGNDVVADILMDHGMKAESFAAIHETRAAAPVAELAKTQTGTVALGLRAPWTAEVVNAMALREASGPLGQFIGPDALLAAAKAYVRANVVDGKFTGKELPGVRIFQDLRGSAR